MRIWLYRLGCAVVGFALGLLILLAVTIGVR
jgi:hypothetical protein